MASHVSQATTLHELLQDVQHSINTNANTLGRDEAVDILRTYQAISVINVGITLAKGSLKNDSAPDIGELMQMSNAWDKMKNDIANLRNKASLAQVANYTILQFSIEQTDRRVEGLNKKLLSLNLTPQQQITKRAVTNGYVSFYDAKSDPLTSCFGNFEECQIEFDGNRYRNSESIFQSQKYLDQPALMTQFQTTDGDAAVKIARQTKMTPVRLAHWDHPQSPEKVNVMMNALRAKFGQNPDLKAKLMATGTAYLVEHLPDQHRMDKFWSDGFDGSGQNQLGICLMWLRGDYGGTGVVAKPQHYFDMLNNPKAATFTPPLSQRNLCVHCNRSVKFVDSQMGKTHDYCGKTCAAAAKLVEFSPSSGVQPLQDKCIVCKQRPQWFDPKVGQFSPYCSNTCRSNSGQ
jgi:N-glycosidase YbiA